MPRLSIDDPLIRLAQVTEKLDNSMADPRELMASQDPGAMITYSQEWQRNLGNLWRRGEQKVLGSVIMNVGIPIGKASDAVLGILQILPPELDHLLEQAFMELRSEIREAVQVLAKKVLDRMVSAGLDIAANMMSAIPIIGWVIDILVTIARFVVDLVKTVRAQNRRERLLYERAGFSPGLDSLYANSQCLAPIQHSKDWNDLFLPLGEEFGRLELKGGGYRYSAMWPSNPYGEVEGKDKRPSCVPGTTGLFRQWEIDGPTSLISTGQYFPATRDVCVSAWGVVNQPGPSMFCVNPGRIRREWLYLLVRLHQYIATLEEPQAKLVRKMAKLQFGGDWGGSWQLMGRTVRPVKAAETLGERQRAAIESAKDPRGPIWAAYVGEDYGAFVGFGGDSRRFVLEEAQRSILERRILPQIDFSCIPPGEFRQAMRARIARATSIAIGELGGAPAVPEISIPGLRLLGDPASPSLTEAPSPGPGLSEAPLPLTRDGGDLVILPENKIRNPSLPPVQGNPDPSSGGGGLVAALGALAALYAGWRIYGRK